MAKGNGHTRKPPAERGRAREAVDRVREAAGDLALRIDLRGRMERNPWALLAGAVGLGFVLGGGLTTRLARRLFGFAAVAGVKAAVLPMLRDEIRSFLRRAGASAEEAAEEPASAR